MTTSNLEERARGWADRLRSATGGIGLPAHVTYRLALIADSAEARYVDAFIPERPGARADVSIVIVTDTAIITATAEQIALGRHPEPGDSTTTVTVRAVRDVIELRLAGTDEGWTPTQFRDLRIDDLAVQVRLRDGTTLTLPQSFRALGELEEAVHLLTSAIRRPPIE